MTAFGDKGIDPRKTFNMLYHHIKYSTVCKFTNTIFNKEYNEQYDMICVYLNNMYIYIHIHIHVFSYPSPVTSDNFQHIHKQHHTNS